MFKLALNAGHGLYTYGKRCMKKLDKNETREWSLNSRICSIIEQRLKEYSNIEVLRLDDESGKKDISLVNRVKNANNFKADFYLSIHHNAGINGGTGGGIETYIYNKASKKSREWQNDLYKKLIECTNLVGNRCDGTKTANFYECRKSKMPCVLVECGFMDSKTDVPIILTAEFATKVADACVEIIVKKWDLKKKETATNNKITQWQKAAIKDGFKFLSGINGVWNKECENIAKKAVCKQRLTYKYKNLTKFIQSEVGAKADGKYGKDTKNLVKAYQKRYGLVCDGIVGLNTWKKILGVNQ